MTISFAFIEFDRLLYIVNKNIAVASRVWELLETPKTIAQLCAQICEEFEVDMQTCEAEVLKFVQVLIDNGIVNEAAAQA